MSVQEIYWNDYPLVHHDPNHVFSSFPLCCENCIFMCVHVYNLAVDYITPLWFFSYPHDRPGSGNDLWELGSAFWLCRSSVNQFDFGCLSEWVHIYTSAQTSGGLLPAWGILATHWQDQGYLWVVPHLRHTNTRRLDQWKRIKKNCLCQQPDSCDVELSHLEKSDNFLKAIMSFVSTGCINVDAPTLVPQNVIQMKWSHFESIHPLPSPSYWLYWFVVKSLLSV